jgi:hypothetical protein
VEIVSKSLDGVALNKEEIVQLFRNSALLRGIGSDPFGNFVPCQGLTPTIFPLAFLQHSKYVFSCQKSCEVISNLEYPPAAS